MNTNKRYRVSDNETGTVYNIEELSRLDNDSYGYIRMTPQTENKSRSTDELMAEAQKIIDRMEKEAEPERLPSPEPKPQPKPVNEIKRLSELLKTTRYRQP